MTKQEAIEVLSEIRSGYNCFDDSEKPYYEALSEAIKALTHFNSDSDSIKNELNELSCSEKPNRSDAIYRQAAIEECKLEFLNPNVERETEELTLIDQSFAKGWNQANSRWIKALEKLPSANPDLSGYSGRLWKRAYDRGYERCRQDAIDALQKEIDEGIPPFNDAGIRCGVRFARNIIEDLPSAWLKPKTEDSGSVDSEQPEIKMDRTNDRLIWQQDAIEQIKLLYEGREDDIYDRLWNRALKGATNAIKHHTPAAQPEVIRCENCQKRDDKWEDWEEGKVYWCDIMDGCVKADDYCSYAERRTDG